ncbi:serine/threonine-protein kinase [Chondromyces apiculatus]|nr:serine/threonine-protein kinase [Chondromyces apiculatus]
MQPGQHITATLRLVQPLGKGGMGSVWIADHLGLGTQVAVKFIAQQLLTDESLVQRFRREAMAAAQIKSPHVAQVFDHGVTAEGIPYIAMELLEGELLGKRVKQFGPLSPRDTATVITQVAKALTRAHQLGIVHRDIKPDNIFLTTVDGDLIVKVIDFGVAKQGMQEDTGMTTTGSMVGTPLYMSPEQLFSAKHADHRADLWSLAVVAYHVMTGRIPFSGDTLGALSVAVHTGYYPPPSTVLQGLPASVDAWFQRALQKDPAHRFQSARELAETLERAVNGAPWTAWTSTALPAAVVGPQASYGPGLGSSAPGAPNGTVGSSAPGMPVGITPPPGALSNSGTPIATGTYPSVAQGSVAMSAVTRAGSGGRHMAAMIVAAAIASVVGAVGAVLLFRGGAPAAGEGSTPAVTTVAPGLGAPPAPSLPAVVASSEPEAPPTATPSATPTTSATVTQAPLAQGTGAAQAPSGRPAPGVGGTSKSTPRPTPIKDTIGF